VFVAGGQTDHVIAAVDYHGGIRKVIQVGAGARDILVDGNSLFVLAAKAEEIAEYDTQTYEKLTSWSTSVPTTPNDPTNDPFDPIVNPVYLSKTGNYVWFSFDCSGAEYGLASLDTTTGAIKSFNHPSTRLECLDHSAIPADPSKLLAWTTQGGEPRATLFDISSGVPVPLRDVAIGGAPVDVAPDGASFLASSREGIQRWRMSDFAPLESYSLPMGGGRWFDQSAEGEFIAAVTVPSINDHVQASVFHAGSAAPVFEGRLSYGGYPVDHNPVGISADGDRFFLRDGNGFESILMSRPRRATPAFEYLARGNAETLIWTQRQSYRSGVSKVFAQGSGVGTGQLNLPGTEAYAGGVDGTNIIFQQVTHANSDVVVYGYPTITRKLYARINTFKWEYLPSLSRPWLLFGRVQRNNANREIKLANTRTKKVVTLDKTRGEKPYLSPGQVNGNYATWVKCTKACSIYRYDAAHRVKKRIASARRESLFGPSVAKDGTVFYGRGEPSCGQKVRMMMWRGGHTSTLTDMPAGQDFYSTFVYETKDEMRVIYDRLQCAGKRTDVRELVVK
jgi:hypothetical protein